MGFRDQKTLDMLLFPVGLPDSSSAVTTAIEFRIKTALAYELHSFIIYHLLHTGF